MDELSIVQYLNQLGSGTFVDALSIFISWIFFLVIVLTFITLISYFLDKKKGRFVFWGVILAVGIHFLVSELLFKTILVIVFDPRIRPYVIDSSIIPLGQIFIDSSFPSSHMAITLAILTVFVYYYHKVLVPATIFVLLMAFSRIHNGMHYPSDVLSGMVMGIVYGILAIYLSRKIILAVSKKRIVRK